MARRSANYRASVLSWLEFIRAPAHRLRHTIDPPRLKETVMPQGKPLTIPDDGLTTKQRRNRHLTVVHTGDMKGKSTAAFGMGLRGWTAGFRIAVFQFVKSPKWRVGEQDAFEALHQIHEQTGQGGPIEWFKMGQGWSWARKGEQVQEQAEIALEGWREVQRRLAAEQHDMYILDEFNYPLKWGWVDVHEVVDTLANRPGKQHVIITGRGAPQELVDAADLVTEMTKIKHPMDVGQKGQKGIEW